MEIKDILRNKRIELGMTMKELAMKVGVSEGTISRWESGEIANMKRDKIQALADALHISPAVIMGWDIDDIDNQIAYQRYLDAKPSVQFMGQQDAYYVDEEARELAEFLFHNPEYKALFDASRKVKKEDLEFVRQMIERMGGTD